MHWLYLMDILWNLHFIARVWQYNVLILFLREAEKINDKWRKWIFFFWFIYRITLKEGNMTLLINCCCFYEICLHCNFTNCFSLNLCYLFKINNHPNNLRKKKKDAVQHSENEWNMIFPSGSDLTKPIAVRITLSSFIHLSHKCPAGLFHHIFQLLPSFRSRKGFLCLRANSGVGLLPGSSALMSQCTTPLRSLCIPTWTATVQKPIPILLLLWYLHMYSALISSDVGM